jgi:hypothetical protein
VAHSLGLICEVSNPAPDALELQFRFIGGQARIFTGQSRAMQREFTWRFLPSAVKAESGAEPPATRR